jgi:hypothetical protein
MSMIALLSIGGFGLVLIGLAGMFALGWTLAGGLVLAVGVVVLAAGRVLDRLAVLRGAMRNARRVIR